MNNMFTNILNFTLRHDYYTNGFSPDFVITPMAATARLLKRNKLILKYTAHGFRISCNNNTLSRLPQILSGRILSFSLRLKNKHFMTITTLPARSGSKDSYYLSCPLQGGAQPPTETVAQYPRVFNWLFTAAGDTTAIQLEDPEGNIVVDEIHAGTAGQEREAFLDLTQHSSGLYRIMVEGQPDENIYIMDEPSANGVFGIAEFTLGDFADFDPETYQALQYEYQFNARASVWEYHLLLSRDYSDYTLAINDTEGTAVFAETAAPPAYTEGSRSIFAAQNPIPYQEAPRRGLQLLLTPAGGGGSTYNDLPGPSIRNPEPKMYLTI